MKVRMAVLSCCSVLLAACATTGEKTARAPQVQGSQPSLLTLDEIYMARVEAMARRRGVGLTWVNPPTKATHEH